MRSNIGLTLLLALFLTCLTSADPRSLDYFPAVLGMEWHYNTSSSSGLERKTKNVVTSCTQTEDGRQNIVITSLTSDAVDFRSHFYKVDGWVYTDKSVNNAGDLTYDLVEDMKNLMNPPKIGESWSYEGRAMGIVVKRKWKIIGVEEVEVPAGKFKAIRIDDSANRGGRITEHSTWYAAGVGAIKTVSTIQRKNGTVVTTSALTKFVIPKEE